MPTDRITATEYRKRMGVPVKTAGKSTKFRSKLEAEYNAILRACVSAKVIRCYDYEPYSFMLCEKPKTSYKPDFVVTNLDGSEVVVEVKGYLRDKDKHRFVWASTLNTDKRFVMVGKKDGRWVLLYDLNTGGANLPKEII
jgi:uncharacterized membrane protein